MSQPPEPDGQAIRSGDTQTFDRLYAELAPRVLGYLLRFTGGDRADAEDLVQETFLAAYAGRSGYHSRSRPLAWLLGIARRRWRDDRRRARPDQTALEDKAESLPSGEAGIPEVVTRAAEMERALALLEPAQREALELVVMQELTYREAAAILGAPVGTIKWRVHQATRTLRRLMSEDEDEEEETEEKHEPARRITGAAAPSPDARPDRAAFHG